MSCQKVLIHVLVVFSFIVAIQCNSCNVTSSPWARLAIACNSFEDLLNYENPVVDKPVMGFTVWNRTSYFVCDNSKFHKFNDTLTVTLKGAGVLHIGKNCFNGMISVRTIDLQDNLLTSIDMKNFRTTAATLEAILLNHNYIFKIDFTRVVLPNLLDFQASNNKVQTVKLRDKNLPQISIMYLEDNLISHFEIESHSMEALHLSRNRIKSFRGTDLVLPNLKDIYLDDNTLTTITADMFENMPNLKTIDLAHNCLHSVSFPTLKHTTFINLMNNRVIKIDRMNCTALKSLNWLQLDSNKVFGLEGETSFENVIRFSCSACFIHAIEPHFLADTFKNLRSLELVNNFLTNATFFQAHDNDLTLTRITLSYNKIERIEKEDFKRLTKVTVMYMNDNEIATIEDGAFDTMLKLKTLDLSNNILLKLPADLFDQTMRLNILHLAGNNMAFFNIPGWQEETGEILSSNSILNKLKRLSISKNPLQCQCMVLIRNWAGRYGIDLWIDDYNVRNGFSPSCIINDQGCQTNVEEDYISDSWFLFNDKKINDTDENVSEDSKVENE